MKRILFALALIMCLSTVLFGQAKKDVKEKANIEISKEQSEWLLMADSMLKQKRNEYLIMVFGRNTIEAEILKGLGLDGAEWKLQMKKGGGYEAVKRAVSEPEK